MMMSVGALSVVSMVMVGYGFSSSNNFLLGMLISLEFMVLILFLSVSFVVVIENLYLPVVLLVMSVCEGSLGLTILVAMVRGFGGDYLSVFGLSY